MLKGKDDCGFFVFHSGLLFLTRGSLHPLHVFPVVLKGLCPSHSGIDECALLVCRSRSHVALAVQIQAGHADALAFAHLILFRIADDVGSIVFGLSFAYFGLSYVVDILKLGVAAEILIGLADDNFLFFYPIFELLLRKPALSKASCAFTHCDP